MLYLDIVYNVFQDFRWIRNLSNESQNSAAKTVICPGGTYSFLTFQSGCQFYPIAPLPAYAPVWISIFSYFALSVSQGGPRGPLVFEQLKLPIPPLLSPIPLGVATKKPIGSISATAKSIKGTLGVVSRNPWRVNEFTKFLLNTYVLRLKRLAGKAFSHTHVHF